MVDTAMLDQRQLRMFADRLRRQRRREGKMMLAISGGVGAALLLLEAPCGLA
jgi:hypothetical protein